jgi:tRNA modification GTPase
VLWLIDSNAEASHPEQWLAESEAPVWVVRNKIDLVQGTSAGPDLLIAISAERGDGLAQLLALLVDFAGRYFGSGEAGLITRERQRILLRNTSDLLQHAAASASQGEEFVAEDMRAAAQQLGRLLGRVDVEDILDSIFRDFCIGK